MTTTEPGTLERKLKSCLAIGTHLVRFTLGERERLALVRISPRGRVEFLIKPAPEDMYSTWMRVKGNNCTSDGVVHVWAARSQPEIMAAFDAAPISSIAVDAYKD